ncbi:MAG: nucleotidyl transferase AbiEii/AbiGii toxin family protein [Nitrospira sp.]|nr:nucleotidyl transferase AbiEii/AbiGii toxin family protein [Nitrospira sp.]
MMHRFVPCLSTLPPAQRQLWLALRPAPNLGLVLYGGTAIAVRLGHRPSVDFDFFTDQPLDKPALFDAFPFLRQATVLQDTPNALTVLIKSEQAADQFVKISFFGTISFGRIGEPEMTDDGILQVASLDDLMATKLKVVLQRIEAKDYQDIVAMLAAGVDLSKGLAGARALYGPAFQPSESLKALVYFEGGDLHRLSLDERMSLIQAASTVRTLPLVTIQSHHLAANDRG